MNKKTEVKLMDFTNAEEWMHDAYKVIDRKKCNKLKQ